MKILFPSGMVNQVEWDLKHFTKIKIIKVRYDFVWIEVSQFI